MAGDRVARVRKWHELIERHGSEEEAGYAIRESPEWAMTEELIPYGMVDEHRRLLALDLMIAADKEARDPAAASEASEGMKLDERTEKSRIPYPSFWWILEQRVKRGNAASVNSLTEHTRRSPRMPFVGRTRVTWLVEWIDANPEVARRALDLHETPAGFRANEGGVIVPRVRKPA